jgi:hypothetical protein
MNKKQYIYFICTFMGMFYRSYGQISNMILNYFFPREVRDKNKESSIYTQNSWIVDIYLILLYLTKCGYCSKKSLKIQCRALSKSSEMCNGLRGLKWAQIWIAWDCEVWYVVLGLKLMKMCNKKQYIYFICTFMGMFYRSLFVLFLFGHCVVCSSSISFKSWA